MIIIRTMALLAFGFALIGCGKSSDNRPSAEQFSDDQTTGSLSSSGKNLEFYSERYLPADQRLKKRQERLLEIVRQ